MKSIGEGIFFQCNKLIRAYYGGTEMDWKYVIVGDYNMELERALFYYSETQPTGEGKYWHYGENGEPVAW